MNSQKIIMLVLVSLVSGTTAHFLSINLNKYAIDCDQIPIRATTSPLLIELMFILL